MGKALGGTALLMAAVFASQVALNGALPNGARPTPEPVTTPTPEPAVVYRETATFTVPGVGRYRWSWRDQKTGRRYTAEVIQVDGEDKPRMELKPYQP